MDEVRIGTTWESVTPGEVESSGFATWQEDQFGPGADPSISGLDADPDGDGIKNLAEYGLGREPLVASMAGLPATGTVEVGEETHLTLTFNRPIGLTDVGYEVVESTDLTTWEAAVAVGSPSDNGDGTEEVTYRHSQPVSDTSRGFLSLELSLQ